MRKILSTLIIGAALFISTTAHGAVTPLSVGLVPPVQFPPDDFTITGARLSLLYGQHRHVYGLDLGLAGNITQQEFGGIALAGLFNVTHGTTTILGLQAAGATNITTEKTSVYGLQIAGGVNYMSAASTVVGFQLALLGNYSPNTNIYGAQVGLYNRAQEVYGLQIGLVNVATNLHGIQIGLVNFNHQGPFSVAPILNVGF